MSKEDKNDPKLLNKEDSEVISQNFSKFANVLQSGANLIQRQLFHNISLVKLHQVDTSGITEKNTINAKTLLSGLPSRFAYNAAVTYPILHIRKTLENENAPKFLINFAAVGIDSTLGTYLELHSSKKILQTLGVHLKTSHLLKASAFSLIPLATCNSITWGVINAKESDSLVTNISLGAVSGATSTPFRNIGMQMAENSIGNSFTQATKKTIEQFARNPTLFIAGGVPRVAAMTLSKIFLSPKTSEFFEDIVKDIFKDSPSNSPKTNQQKKELAITPLDATKGSKPAHK